MQRRFTTGLVLAVLFTLANIGGGVYAAAMHERQHTVLHIVLTIVGAWTTWQILARRRASASALAQGDARPRELTSRLSNLEQSLDAIAVEVERVGEGQRYMTQLFAEHSEHQDKPR